MANEHEPAAFCPAFHKSVELIGRRWTGAILRAMRFGQVRFSDISDVIPGLHDRLLSERLKELEHEGVISRTVIPETPVRIEYHLSEKGRALYAALDAIADWAEEWVTVAPAEAARQKAQAEAEAAVCDELDAATVVIR